MTTTTINISLSSNLKEKALEEVEKRNYSNVSDYVRQLIRSDIEKRETHEALRHFLQEGIDSGASDKTHKQVFAELRSYIQDKA